MQINNARYFAATPKTELNKKKRTGYDYEIKNMLKNWASKIANTIETKKKHT